MRLPACPLPSRWLLLLLLCLAGSLPALAQDANALYREAEGAWGEQQYAQALAGFKAFVEQFGEDARAPRALHRIGECHGALGEFAPAAEAFKLCYTRYPDSNVADSAMFNEGFYYFRAEQWHPAAFAYFNYIKLGQNPVYKAQAWYWRAEALYQLARFGDAIKAYQELLAQPPTVLQDPSVVDLVPYARYSIAVSWFELQQYAEALAAAEAVVQQHPTSPIAADSLWYGGLALRELKQTDKAIRLFQRLPDDYPKSPLAPDALYAIFELEQARGKSAAATAAKERLQRDYPDAEALVKGAGFRVAAERLAAGDYAAAKRLYQEALHGAKGDAEAAGLLGLAESTFGLAQWDEAIASYQKLLARHPTDASAPRAQLRLGEALLRDGQYKEAEAAYQQFLKQRPEAAEVPLARYNLALALYQQGRQDEAMELYQQVAAEDAAGETGPLAMLELGRWHLDHQHPAEAQRAYQDYLRAQPQGESVPQALWGAGEAFYALEDWPQAETQYRRLSEKFPHHELAPRALYRLAEIYRRTDDTAKAERIAAILREKYPDSALTAASLLQAGRASFKGADYPAAVASFEEFLKQYPDHDDVPVALANLAASLYLAESLPDHWTRAAEAYAELGRKHPTVAEDAFFWAGSAYLEATETVRARDALEAYLKNRPRGAFVPRARLLLGKALVALDQPADGITALREAVRAAGDDAAVRSEALYELAWALISTGTEEEGYKLFAELVAKYPDSALAPDAEFRLAGRFYQLEQYDAAEQAYRRWLDRFPDHSLRPKVLYNLAFALEAQADWVAAAAQYEVAEAALAGTDDELRQQALYHRAMSVYRAGDLPGALAALDAFDRAFPDSKLRPGAIYYRGLVYSAEEKWAAAEPLFREIAERHADHYLAPQARFNLGVTVQNQERYQDAEGIYTALLEQPGLPDELRADALLHLGEVRYALKDYPAALDALLRAERGGVDEIEPAARYWAGLCYQLEGEVEKAREKLSAVINDAPGSDWAAKAKRALEQLE